MKATHGYRVVVEPVHWIPDLSSSSLRPCCATVRRYTADPYVMATMAAKKAKR